MSSSHAPVIDMSIRDIGVGYRDGRWAPRDVLESALERLSQTEPKVHAWALVDADRALEVANQAEKELRDGIDKGSLHGIPVGIKDIFDVAGWPTRCGSAARRDTPPASRDAVSVAALRSAGAVLLGKTVTQEFAAGVISEPARNPWDEARVPGGSSGGSAVAVALGVCQGALGSDTGGSIRIPAAACGVVGFKPAFGHLSTTGVYPLSWSLDTVGPLARTVDDAWIMWRTLIGDTHPTLRPEPCDDRLGDMKVGVLRGFFARALQPDVGERANHAVEALRQRGATVVEVDWTLAEAARALAFVINRVETAAVHERTAVEEPNRFALMGDDLRLRVAAGSLVPATLYLNAKSARLAIRASMAELFRDYALDALIAPTLPTTAVPAETPVITGTGLDESIGAAWTRLTMPFNATGQPALALPVGFDGDGLPIGIQLAGKPGAESTLFRIGLALERELGLHDRRPPLVQEISHGRR